MLDALNGTLAQSDRVALALLRKFYDPLGNQQGRRVLAIHKPQLTQGPLEGELRSNLGATGRIHGMATDTLLRSNPASLPR